VICLNIYISTNSSTGAKKHSPRNYCTVGKALQLEKQNKKRHKQLFDHIIQEAGYKYHENILDPVPLVREDRER
jgi:hypothetical protein